MKISFSILLYVVYFGQYIYSQTLENLSFGTDSTFDVVTWNIERFPKNGITTVDSVSKIIEQLDVDLIGIQEIDDSTKFRQLIDNLNGYELFMDNGWFGGLGYVYKTNTINIQSIYKIYDTSPYWNPFPRSPLVIELTFMGENFIVINNHFKCCGDGIVDLGNSSDEEYRRYRANVLLKQYVDANFASDRVMIIGDLNDVLTDTNPNNVFKVFLNDQTGYLFADRDIASGTSANWSFPGWPSHLDHILITNELFADFQASGSVIETIKVDDYMSGGFSNYNYYISDHRPVGIKVKVEPNTSDLIEKNELSLTVFPNPTFDLFSIDLRIPQADVKVKIIDLKGQIVHAKEYRESKTINVDFKGDAGLYLLIVESAHKKSVVKLIKTN